MKTKMLRFKMKEIAVEGKFITNNLCMVLVNKVLYVIESNDLTKAVPEAVELFKKEREELRSV